MGSVDSKLGMVSAAGGEVTWVEVPGLKEGGLLGPEFLPGGDDFLVLFMPDEWEEGGVYMATLRSGKPADPSCCLRTRRQYTIPLHTADVSSTSAGTTFIRKDWM